MGTSNAYGGPAGDTPLIPSWFRPDGVASGPLPGDGSPAPSSPTSGCPAPNPSVAVPDAVPPVPSRPPIPPIAEPNRFKAARNNLTRFASSGGHDRASLGRAVFWYVSKSAGGARQAAQRMGSARAAGAGLWNFLSSAATSGPREALRALNLENLVARPVQEIFLGLADYLCPDGGTVDEGIAREAFIETIADLAETGISDLDSLTMDQTQTIFEIYATNAIETRLCNDIGTNAITIPVDVREATRIQSQLRDLIYRGVADALTVARAALPAMTPDRVLGFVTGVYEHAFGILQSLGEAEADKK